MKNFAKAFLTLTVCALVIFECGCAKNLNFNSFISTAEFNKGLKAYNEQNYDKAIVNFTNALNNNPESYAAYCYLGTSYMYQGDEKNAQQVLTEAIKKFPKQWNAYTFLGELKHKQHNYEQALEYYQKAVDSETIPEGAKPYYKKLIADITKEEFNWNSKGSIPVREKINPKNALPSFGVLIQLDEKIFEKAFESTNDENGIIEYGKKGEDIINYKWTELVTVQYFAVNKDFSDSAQDHFNKQIKAIESVAHNKSFVRKTIEKSENEILYEWSFDNAKESEIARIIRTDTALYHLHYAKKGAITPEEKEKWTKILKEAKVGVK